jgi:hypothetical protein
MKGLLEVRRQLTNHAGITLLDLLVGLMLLGVGAVGIFAGFKSALTGWTTGQQFVGEQHNARVVLDWTTRRLRMAGNEYPGARFQIAAAGEILFYGNTDGDPAIECHHIYLDAGVAEVNTTEATCAGFDGQPLTANVEARTFSVTALTLRYFDGDDGSGNELTALPLNSLDRAKIRRIEIEIRVAGVQAASPTSMTTQVKIRN